MTDREFAKWARQMREQGVKGPLWAPDHDPATCSECQRLAAMTDTHLDEKDGPPKDDA